MKSKCNSLVGGLEALVRYQQLSKETFLHRGHKLYTRFIFYKNTSKTVEAQNLFSDVLNSIK